MQYPSLDRCSAHHQRCTHSSGVYKYAYKYTHTYSYAHTNARTISKGCLFRRIVCHHLRGLFPCLEAVCPFLGRLLMPRGFLRKTEGCVLMSIARLNPIYCASVCYFSGPCAHHLLCLCVLFIGRQRPPSIVPLCVISRASAPTIYCASVCHFLVPCAAHLLCLCV
jgi:hypothetical protein